MFYLCNNVTGLTLKQISMPCQLKKQINSNIVMESNGIPQSVIGRLDPVVKRVFAEGDFHRVEMRSIARDAGMSFATIYRYFTDKEKLLFWFIAYWLKEVQLSAIEALDSEGSALERIRRYLIAHFIFYEKNPQIGRIIFMTVPLERWMRDDTYAYKEPMRRLRSVIQAGQRSGEIRSDVNSETIIDLFSGIFNRTFLMWEYRGRTYSLVEQYDTVRPLIESGLLVGLASQRDVPKQQIVMRPGTGSPVKCITSVAAVTRKTK